MTLLPDLAALAGSLAGQVDAEFAPLMRMRETLRAQLLESGDIRPYPAAPARMPDSMCAIDGARVNERMYAGDLLTAVATSADARSCATKYSPDSAVWAAFMRHDNGVEKVSEAAMASLELAVAVRAPHQMRIIDGSFVTPMIGLRQGLFVHGDVQTAVARVLTEWDAVSNLATLMEQAPGRVLALAKSDSSTHYVHKHNVADLRISDRFLATQLLQPGEMFSSMPLKALIGQKVDEQSDRTPGDVSRVSRALGEVFEHLSSLARQDLIRTTYFKPHTNAGAGTVLRFEYALTADQLADDKAVAAEYAAIINQDVYAPHMLEPFCQYTVDRQAKQISDGTQMLRERMMQMLPDDKAASYRALLATGYRS